MSRVRVGAFLFSLLVVGVLAGCGGGSGGGDGPPPCPGLDPDCTPEDYETSEYNAQAGLRLINASSIYARGGTGKGVTVGVFDSGASPDHPGLAGKYVLTDGMSGTNPIDSNGHGTHVAGIITANKDGSEMHGVAYDARLASYALDYSHENFDRELAAGIDIMRERGVYITNNSWGTSASYVSIVSPDAYNYLVSEYGGHSADAYLNYVAAGGVQVWAAGNDYWRQLTVEAGAPYLFPELEAGWLAVVAVDLEGNEASYTNRCGVAAAWCLAAPGGDDSEGVYSTVPDGYERFAGTSMAAPHVAGALAALKSLFPNLSYQDIRDRILFTADSTGIYANESIYGHGLLDLDTASRPVGGTAFALGAYDAGAIVTTNGALVTLPSAAISRYLADRSILILDNYQRAPFLVPISAFAGAGDAYLSLSDLDLETPERSWDDRGEAVVLTIATDDFQARGVSNGTWFSAAGQGARVMEGMASLVGVPLPHGNYRMADDAVGVTLGLASEEGEFYTSAATGAADRTGVAGFGIVGWSPETVLTASFVPNGAVGVFGASVASELVRPMGWAGAGALEISGDSFELAYSRNIVTGESYRLGVASRLAHLATETSPLIRFDDALLATTELDLSVRLGSSTTLNARLGMERPVTSSKGSIRAASSIDEDGRIEYDDIAIDGSDFLAFDKAGLSVGYAYGPNMSFGAGIAAVRDGFGETEAIAGAQAAVRF